LKLAIVDLDMVVADNTKRMEIAETKREFYRQHLGDAMPDALANPVNHAQVQKGFDDLLDNLYWQAAFNPQLVSLDTLIEGANEIVLDLRADGYKVVFLTSRPESMRHATERWLFEHTVYDRDDELVMKPPAFQFTKTSAWKAGMVQTLSMFYGGEDVMFIDDDQSNIDELVKHGSLDGALHVWCYRSLIEAVKPI